MMNIKKTINFTDLRNDGPGAIDIKDDEVIQLVSKGSKTIKCIVTQEYLLTLETAYNSLLIHAGLKKEEIIDCSKIDMQEFVNRINEISQKAQNE